MPGGLPLSSVCPATCTYPPLSTRLYPERVDVAAADAIVASHERLADRGHVRYDWQHYIALVQRKPGALRNGAPFADLPAPLQRLRLGLMRHAGGDRVMAQVLAAVPTAGLEAVLVAVDLVVESGALSAEHVLNVVARLNAAPVPDSVCAQATKFWSCVREMDTSHWSACFDELTQRS